MKLFRVFTDEQGNASAARVFLGAELAFLWWQGADLSPDLIGLHSAVATFLIVWAAGPRAAQYLGPQLSGVVQALTKRLRGVDRSKVDDER